MTAVRESTGWDRVFWEQDHQWPRGDRHNVFLAAAVLEVGSAMFGPEWIGDEPCQGVDFDPVRLQEILHDPIKALYPKPVAPARVPYGSSRHGKLLVKQKPDTPSPSNHNSHVMAWKLQQKVAELKENIEKQYDSFGRLVEVCDWIAARGRDGDLITRGRWKIGGEFFVLKDSVWNTEPVWEKRVRECEIKRWSDHSPPRLMDTYLFLDRDSLARCLADLRFAPKPGFAPPAAAEGVWLSPFMEVLIETARICEMGPAPDQHPDVEYIQDRMREIATARGIGPDVMTPNLLKTAATLIRHPDAKEGVKVWKAKLRAAQGSDPKM